MVVNLSFTDYEASVLSCMESAGAAELLVEDRPVMLKPNLVTDAAHPVTTAPAMCAAVIGFVRKYSRAPIVVAEGSGAVHLDTATVFARLGYRDLARRLKVELLDLNQAPTIKLRDERCRMFPEMWLPRAVFSHVLISLPVLKFHSLCRFTGSMKNMMGLLPPRRYAGGSGSWKKAAFHQRLDAAIVELNRYRSPDFTVMDASVGLSDHHLGGACCDPPAGRMLAGGDARAVDREAAAVLGVDWRKVGHLA
jgi:uncharacterized protein (DUF362 family)